MRHILTLIFILFAPVGLVSGCGDASSDDTQTRALAPAGHGDRDTEAACDAARHAAQASKPHKISICHVPPGNPDNAHTINISKKALRAHLAHGDVLHGCGCDGDDEGDDPPANTPDEPESFDPPDDGPQTFDDPPDDGGPSADNPPPGEPLLCDSDQTPCTQDAECGSNRACDATSRCCVDVFL